MSKLRSIFGLHGNGVPPGPYNIAVHLALTLPSFLSNFVCEDIYDRETYLLVCQLLYVSIFLCRSKQIYCLTVYSFSFCCFLLLAYYWLCMDYKHVMGQVKGICIITTSITIIRNVFVLFIQNTYHLKRDLRFSRRRRCRCWSSGM
jgi:hypothetical protein